MGPPLADSLDEPSEFALPVSARAHLGVEPTTVMSMASLNMLMGGKIGFAKTGAIKFLSSH